MQSIVHTEVNGVQAAGGFIWGFRGHRHDGGFYWHKEYTGHYSYHLPGFPDEGKANQEMEVVNHHQFWKVYRRLGIYVHQIN